MNDLGYVSKTSLKETFLALGLIPLKGAFP